MPSLGVSTKSLAAIALAGATAAYGLAVYLPIQRQIGRLREEVRDRERTLDQGEHFLAAIRLAEERRDAAAQRVARWARDIPRNDETYAAFAAVQEMADQAGLKTTRFDPQPSVAYTALVRTPVTFAFQGTFPEMYSFLGSLDSLSHVIWVERLVLRDIGEDSAVLRCEVNLGVFADNRGNSD